MSSTCFEPENSSSGKRLYIHLWYGMFNLHQYKQFYFPCYCFHRSCNLFIKEANFWFFCNVNDITEVNNSVLMTLTACDNVLFCKSVNNKVK